jgi:hypothetical protein
VYQNSGKENMVFENALNIQLLSKRLPKLNQKTSNSCSATGFSALMVSHSALSIV